MKPEDKIEYIKGKPARNRIGLPPMDTLMSEDGFVNDFHIQHYGSRSFGGLGTIIVESTAISEEGKIRSKDLGIWKEEHIEGMTKLAKIIKLGGALAGLQINHAGSKAEMDDIDKIGTTMFYDYLPQKRLKLITEKQIEEIEEKFINAAKRAKRAGFDFVEVHGAHGYLLNQLMNPKLNDVIKSNDILIRGKIVINILKRIKEEVGIPAGLRLSVSDVLKGNMEPIDYKPMIEAVDKYVNYFNVSTGETVAKIGGKETIDYFGGEKIFRILPAKEVRKYTKKPIFIASNISTRDDAQFALDNQVDLALIGRESILNPSLFLTEMIDVENIDENLYHWNNNIWYNHKEYLSLMKMLKLK
ncbi:MAG: hypothetical protein HRT99_01785 [Mycoplasmatales bacterium]|nr:hypothetical protein [Mycoplasmatales bacterium]